MWLILSSFTTEGIVHRARNSTKSTWLEIVHYWIGDYNKSPTYAATDSSHAYISDLSSNTSERELCTYKRQDSRSYRVDRSLSR
jgi:hypothetical protein